MSISYGFKAASILALLVFSFYMAEQNKDDSTRKRWKSILAAIILVYFAGKMIEEFKPLIG